VPKGTVAAVGAMANETSAGGPTVKVAAVEIEPAVAVITAVPMALALASPAPLTPATLLDELHVTEPVRFCVEPSVYVPTAENCCVVPCGMESADGVMASETRAGAPIVKLALAEIEPALAVIVVVPEAVVLATPVTVMLATLLDDAQFTEPVRFCTEPLV
jgi:hypothetical protein